MEKFCWHNCLAPFLHFPPLSPKRDAEGGREEGWGRGPAPALTPGWPLQPLPSSFLQWGPFLCSVSISNHEGGFRHLPFLLLSGLYTPSWAGRVEGEGSGASGMDRSRTCHPGGVSSLGPSTSTHPRGCIMEIITLPHRDAVRTETTYETRLAQKRSPVSISSPSPASHPLPTHALELYW